MIEISGRNVNEVFPEAIWKLRLMGVKEHSRNGPVLVAPTPVITTYRHPQERVLLHSVRDANPVFHLMEAIWMIAGHRDVWWLSQFNSNIVTYAEDDGHIHGAYGYRWRSYFGFDQLRALLDELENKTTRQAVLSMWHPAPDLGARVRDKPCNTHIYFDRRDGALNMTVCCRSNDMIWGAYGANVVHFSFLQELLASELRIPIGVYRQFSNNFHVYPDVPVAQACLNAPHDGPDPYTTREEFAPVPLVAPHETFDQFSADCEYLIHHGYAAPLATNFMKTVALPLMLAYQARKRGEPAPLPLHPCDWTIAYQEWVARREAKKEQP